MDQDLKEYLESQFTELRQGQDELRRGQNELRQGQGALRQDMDQELTSFREELTGKLGNSREEFLGKLGSFREEFLGKLGNFRAEFTGKLGSLREEILGRLSEEISAVRDETHQTRLLFERLEDKVDLVAEGVRTNTETMHRHREESREEFREFRVIMGSAHRHLEGRVSEHDDRLERLERLSVASSPTKPTPH